jgi:hypothetical protein
MLDLYGMKSFIHPGIAGILLSLGLATGCAGGMYRGSVAVTASTPDLVYAAPGVQVIADYDEPIFYSDGFYWWNYDGLWYRSGTYTGGWAYVAAPPVTVVRIGEPYRYRHYRPSGYIVHNRPVPAHRVQRPIVRDHRSQTTVRDHDRGRRH